MRNKKAKKRQKGENYKQVLIKNVAFVGQNKLLDRLGGIGNPQLT